MDVILIMLGTAGLGKIIGMRKTAWSLFTLMSITTLGILVTMLYGIIKF